MDIYFTEYVVLTPKSKTGNSTILVVERCASKEQNNGKNNAHVAGGEHHGIIVNKTAVSHGIIFYDYYTRRRSFSWK